MPEGSSSAAPAVKPGPSALDIRLGVRGDRLPVFMDAAPSIETKFPRARTPFQETGALRNTLREFSSAG